MGGLSGLKRFFRRPSRREVVALLLLAVFAAVAGPFGPYDDIQRSVSARLNAKPYQGNSVIVAVDAKTQSELPAGAWTKRDLAKLLGAIDASKPKQILVGRQYFDESTETETQELADALAKLPEKPAWQIDLATEDVRELTPDASRIFASERAPASRWVEPEIASLVNPAADAYIIDDGGAPAYTPYVFETGAGIVPSLASILAGDTQLPEVNGFELDVAYDPATISQFSAIDVLSGRVPGAELKGKSIIIGFTSTVGRDAVISPHDPYTPRVAAVVIAAQTLIDGPRMNVGFVPAFLIALLVCLLWFMLPRPFGRWIAVIAFLTILLSPLMLERFQIYNDTADGLSLIFLFGIGRIWQTGREAVQVYRSAAETKSRFLAQASHDLRQPIHAIGLLADRLSHTDLSPDQKEIVSKISWSVDNARRMFRALLDIAAIESGTVQKEITTVSINGLLAEVDSQNALVAEQSGVDLRLVPSDLVIKTDRALIGTMLQNLVSNAIRYSSAGKVIVGCRRVAGGVSLWVADSGRGIAPDELEAVQEEFYRSAQRSSLGSDNKGLGLAIVNRLARLLNLRFSLDSELGKGTVARISGLKIVASSEVSEQPDKGVKLPLSGVQVVVADDDQETLASTSQLLERWGCSVTALTDPPDGSIPCDIILSDFDFGELGSLADRPDLLSRLAELDARMIIISGHHPDQIRDELPEHDGLILTKPLRAAQLRSALMSIRKVQ